MTTTSTCNSACWLAQEAVCRCMCGGANHGVMTRGGSQPGRYRRRGGIPYRLDAIHETWNDVMTALGRIYQDLRGPYRGAVAFMEKASGGQLKWPEVENFLATARFRMAYLLWIRDDREEHDERDS